MESGRTYKSDLTRKLSFRVEMGSANNESQISGELDNREEALENQNNSSTNLQESEELNTTLTEAQGKLNQTAGIRQISYFNPVEEYNALEEIRQRCILYLWTIFFGESTANEMADKMGLGKSSNWLQTKNGMSGQMQQMMAYSITAERETVYAESENTSFSTTGCVKTADGREISFNLEVLMSRNFVQYSKETVQNVASFVDPLVINLNGNIAEVSDQKIYFDLDADGEEEAISRLCEDSGYLALDLNCDGKINDGSELFGTKGI